MSKSLLPYLKPLITHELQRMRPIIQAHKRLLSVSSDANLDIDRYIESKYVLPQERKAAMQLARSLQQMLLVNTSDAAALRATTEAGGKAIDCIFDTFSQEDGYQQGSRLSSALEALTTNTKVRLQAYLAFNRAVSGSVTGSFKGRGCD